MAGVSRRVENDQLYGRQRKRESEHEANAKTAQMYYSIVVEVAFPLLLSVTDIKSSPPVVM